MLVFLILLFGCKDQLDIVNPNKPTPENVKTEQGILSFAQGALYVNGLQQDNFLYFFSSVLNTHERTGDLVGSNENPAEVYCPDNITLDNGSNLISINPNGQKQYLKDNNTPSNKYNTFYVEWKLMYAMNNAMNNVLANVDEIVMSDSKKNTLKAWAYFWKGFSYSRIGSMYYAGIINDEPNKTNSKYVTREEILIEAESNFVKTETLLQSLTGNQDYEEVLSKLIPSTCQVGKGEAPSTVEWIRNINTMRARNLLLNTPVISMTTTQWDKLLTLTSNGIKVSDNTFTVRTDELGNLLPALEYTAAQAIGPDADGGGFLTKVGERFIQEFRSGDQRFSNNFKQIPTWIGPDDRGAGSNTRFVLVDKGNGIAGAVVMVDTEVGAHELYIAGSYEENVLMLAEANIYKGNIDAGLAGIDELRNYQGAGLAATAGTGLTADQAKEELRRERRVGLAFRGFAFYDARRWGVLKNGRTGCVVVDFDGTVSTNATIQYGYLDYWDVPVFEFFYNPASADSAPIVNPD